MIAILGWTLMILGWTAVAAVNPQALTQLGNAGPHGFSEMLYLYSSSAGNNGSAFGGITGNCIWDSPRQLVRENRTGERRARSDARLDSRVRVGARSGEPRARPGVHPDSRVGL